MALSSRILALFCFTAAIPLVYSIDSDLYFSSSFNQIVPEDVGSVFIDISSRGSVERKAYLYFYPYLGVTQATSGMDYEFANINSSVRIFNFTISPSATKSFEVTIIDDNIAEFWREYIRLELFVYGFTGIDFVDRSYIHIEDNDGAYFLPRYINVYEDTGGDVELCIQYPSRDDLPQTFNASVSALYRTYDDGDYTFNADGVPFILMAGGSVYFNVTINDDDRNERIECFFFRLYHHNDIATWIDEAGICVYDNEEAAYVGFENTSYSVLESDGVVTVCLSVDRGDGTEEFYMYLFIANLTTQGEADHEQLPWYQVTFLIDENVQCFNISITDDDIEEDVEYFEIFFDDRLYYSGIYPLTRNPRIYPLSTARVAIITIYDDDSTCNPECVNGVCRSPGVCVCDEGWTDEDCSHEIQVCQVPCGDNGVCNIDTGNCDCSPGYTGAPCEDIPDCDIDNGNCEQICTNFIGGYSCSCKEGFLLSEVDQLSCNDIDECMEEDHSCNQICVNTPGSYYCNCEPGFQPVSVTECEDVNECSVLPNGFCRQICVNTYGSYHCECMEGYRLVRASFCEDIDECVEMSDACDKSQPAPADCINLPGSHRCSCDRYSGYRLSADGTTCEDVDECSEGTHLCTDMCLNTPGSYSCSCPAGFELDSSDGQTCHDINECDVMNGGCDHDCSNTYGSFNCSCNQGYLLLEDGLKCQALKCLPVLVAPSNGAIQCDTQAVGGTCTFSCDHDKGFTLRGSESRTCTPSLQWTGPPTVCDPPMCPALRPPSNGLVSFPCTREEGDACRVTCAYGYNSTGPDMQICELNSTMNDDLIWSEGPECIESDPCYPNPCSNGGKCVRDGNSFTCACNGTGYGGITCERAIIYFLSIQPIINTGPIIILQIHISTFANLTSSEKVSVTVMQGRRVVKRDVLTLDTGSNQESITITGEVGIMTAELSGGLDFIYEPPTRNVFLPGKLRDESIEYFSYFNLPRGLLKPSCCWADNLVTLSCPGNSTEIVSLRSPCAWSTPRQAIETAGIVFAEGSNLILPTSISGLRYRNDNKYVNEYLQKDKRCDLCSACNGTGSGCYCYTHTPANTQEFLIARALAFTYISEMSQLLPPWLNMFVPLTLDSSPISDYDTFAKVTRPMEQVSSINGCGKLTSLANSVYSVMRHDKTLSVVIAGEQYDYRENADTGSTGDAMCFAVDLCHESDSPVHMQISQPINDILVSEYLRQFSGHIRNIRFNTVSLFKHLNLVLSQTPFWNGTHMISVSPVEADVSLSADVGLEFTDGDLMIRLEFCGNGDLNYREREGLLDGQFGVFVDNTIDGVEQQLQLSSTESMRGYYSISDDEDLCTAMSLSGISFSVSYEPLPGETFFSHLLRFSETTQECNFQVYLPVDADFNIQGLSLHTECPLLALSELILPEMSHTLNFIGSKADCFGSDFLGVSDPALVIESELTNDRLPLGNILQLRPDSDGPDILTVYGRGADSGYTARFPNMQVSLFGVEFEANANIVNNMMEIAAISTVFGYPAELTISAPSNLSDWGELMLTVQGSLLPGEGSFLQRLSNEVVKKFTKLGNSGKKRREVAQMSLDQSKERFRLIDKQFTQADLNVTQAEQRKNATREDIVTIQEQLTKLEREFNNSQDNLTGLMEQLDANCTEQLCEDVCMPGESCRNCARPTFVVKRSKCPIMVQETRTIRIILTYRTVTNWTYVLECRLESNQICQNDDCPIGEKENCHGKCVPVVLQVPVYSETMVEFDIYTYENCILEVFNGSVPDTCCENVTCAVFAPEPSCVSGNAMCRVARQEALDNVEDLREEGRELFQRLLEARKNLSLATIAAKRANIDCYIYKQRRDQLEMSRDRLQDACDKSVEVYDKTLEEIEPLLKIHNGGNNSGYENIFKVNSVTFDERLVHSPSSLALNIAFEKTIDGSTTEYKDDVFVYISQLNEANFDRIADDIIDIAFFGKAKRSVERIGRQAPQELTQRQIFDSRCAHLSNIQLFFMEIQASLMEVQESIEGSRNSSSSLSQTLTDEGPPEDEEFSAYLDLVRGYEELSMEALFTLESTIFSEWQAIMELLYSESGSVGEASCDGFADCLQTAVDELQNLIDLTPENELNEESLSLESNIPMAETSLLELALLSDISIDEGLTKIEPIIEITSAYATNNYWCNKPPVMIIQPPLEVNVSLGGTLNLSCKAESSLTVTYHWERDGSVLPQYTTNELVIPMVQRRDSANYTCFANNPVGQAESITTSVTVYEVPEFYLTPESVVTYFGDGNGAWFACNATAWPYPGWRWFHRKKASENWMMIEGENTNELLILNPQQEHEGMYACEAYNYHGSIRSEPASLTLLPFTVSQHRFPLLFTVISSNQSCNLDELYIYDSLYSLISETISGETVIIEEFNITEVDNETYDVSLSLTSENVTTYYLNFLTFAEIANLALPYATSLRRSVQLIEDLIEGNINGLICPGPVTVESFVVGRLTYVCPPGQRLNSDYLLCLSCERGQISTEIEHSRIVNGVGYTENVAVCEACPLDTYADGLGSTACLPCPKYHTTTSTGATSIEECRAQPLVLECMATTTSGHVDISCKTNRPPLKTLCSFNGQIQHTCSYPLVINRDVSPLGNHAVTIYVEDDKGFQAETTVHYFLEEDIKPTVPAVVPPLVVSFVGDSPRVQGDTIEADILISRPVQSLVCRLKGDSLLINQNCSSGHVMFLSLKPDVYTLRVVATNRHPDKEFIKRHLEITDDPERCILHFINSGVTVTDGVATVEFASQGPAQQYNCYLDKMHSYECSSPVVLEQLTPGEHQLKVVPTGCGKNKRNLKANFKIE